jgi:hypothetical protein
MQTTTLLILVIAIVGVNCAVLSERVRIAHFDDGLNNF